jgi:hypothetical protein
MDCGGPRSEMERQPAESEEVSFPTTRTAYSPLLSGSRSSHFDRLQTREPGRGGSKRGQVWPTGHRLARRADQRLGIPEV